MKVKCIKSLQRGRLTFDQGEEYLLSIKYPFTQKHHVTSKMTEYHIFQNGDHITMFRDEFKNYFRSVKYDRKNKLKKIFK